MRGEPRAEDGIGIGRVAADGHARRETGAEHGVRIALVRARGGPPRERGRDDRVRIVGRVPSPAAPRERGGEQPAPPRRGGGSGSGRPVRLGRVRPDVAQGPSQRLQLDPAPVLPVNRHAERGGQLRALGPPHPQVEQPLERKLAPVDGHAELGPERLRGLGARPPLEQLAQRMLLPRDGRPQPTEGGGGVLPPQILHLPAPQRLRLGLGLRAEPGRGPRRLSDGRIAGGRRPRTQRGRERPQE